MRRFRRIQKTTQNAKPTGKLRTKGSQKSYQNATRRKQTQPSQKYVKKSEANAKFTMKKAKSHTKAEKRIDIPARRRAIGEKLKPEKEEESNLTENVWRLECASSRERGVSQGTKTVVEISGLSPRSLSLSLSLALSCLVVVRPYGKYEN